MRSGRVCRSLRNGVKMRLWRVNFCPVGRRRPSRPHARNASPGLPAQAAQACAIRVRACECGVGCGCGG
eukprot:4219389-Alexandrium_andersonii.AAC.1